jgi:hypothetical protein
MPFGYILPQPRTGDPPFTYGLCIIAFTLALRAGPTLAGAALLRLL